MRLKLATALLSAASEDNRHVQMLAESCLAVTGARLPRNADAAIFGFIPTPPDAAQSALAKACLMTRQRFCEGYGSPGDCDIPAWRIPQLHLSRPVAAGRSASTATKAKSLAPC